MRREETACCIVGGGPAGMVAGLLLARQGADVLVLEKHGDFLRDFRGDTIHPSTLELISELGWIDEFLQLPHTEMRQVTVDMAGTPVTFADFSRLNVSCPYVAFMPQWDFLDFVAGKAGAYPGFRILMNDVIVCIDRGEYWQFAYVIPHGQLDAVKAAGLEGLRSNIVELSPRFADRVEELGTWEDVRFLSVRVDRLRRWFRSGLLCIGDAAHAMSPAGGVGINLAVQDAVATANILGPSLRHGHRPAVEELRRVQRRRQFATRVTQAVQVRVLRGLYPKDLHDDRSQRMPFAFRHFRRAPFLRHVTGRFIGNGVTPEHIRTTPRRR